MFRPLKFFFLLYIKEISISPTSESADNTDNDPVVQTVAVNKDNDPVVQTVADNTDEQMILEKGQYVTAKYLERGIEYKGMMKSFTI
jgi:hypothetical protein